MGGSSSKDVVTLWVRVKVQTAENFSYSTQPAADQRSVVGTEKMLELELPGRTTIQEVKEILYHQHNVFPGLSIAQWTLAITGMDGTPKMFAYPAKDNVPDVNAYLYETGIIEVLLPSDPDALFSNNAHESLKETHAPLRRTSDTIIVIVALFFQAAECTAYVPDDDE